MTAKERGYCFRASSERHMSPPYTLPLGDLFHGDVQGRAGTRRTVIDLPRIGLGVSKQFLKGLPGGIASYDDPECVARYGNDIAEIAGWIERCLGHEWKAEDRDRNLGNRITISFSVSS